MFNSKAENILIINLAIAYDYIKDLLNFGLKNNCNYNREQTQIDCIFRSGNEYRTSGFFPCHSLYSEIIVFDKLWPEINIEDFKNVIYIYNNRHRRFGK